MPSWKALAPVLVLWREADAFFGREMAQESRQNEELKKLAAQQGSLR